MELRTTLRLYAPPKFFGEHKNVILQVVFDELGDNMEINQSDSVAEALAIRKRK
jgi:hypothetical protein